MANWGCKTKMQCSLDFLYYLTRPALSIIYFHKHQCYELVYYLTGTGSTNIDGKDYNYCQGSFSIIEPTILHDEHRHKDTDVIFIGFQYDGCPVEVKNGLYIDDQSQNILKILLLLKDELLEKKAYYQIKLDSLLKDLVVSIARMSSADNSYKGNLSHVHHFLKENFHQVINYHTLAELSGYSYDRFRHKFKEVYGLSPHQYIIRLRLENAHKMLLETNHSISRISQENGFSSESQFGSLFKKTYGCTPGQVRT